MAKRIGVLEPHDPPVTDPANCANFVSKSVARYLIRKLLAVKVAPRVIQMLTISTLSVNQTVSAWFDGPLGVGNLVPFAKENNLGDKLHYEIPRAGDRGAFARHRRKLIRVSARSRFNYPAALPPTTTFASGLLAG